MAHRPARARAPAPDRGARGLRGRTPALNAAERPFQIVFVCTGNRFRSPLAAELFRAATAELPVAVSSCGTFDADGFPALDDAIELARALGIDLSRHRSRALASSDLSGADLVVGFERRHLAAAVVDAGARRERTFGALELSELLARVEPPGDLTVAEQARAAVALAHAARERSPRPLRELPDPIGRGRRVAAETVREVDEHVARIAFGLFEIAPSPRA